MTFSSTVHPTPPTTVSFAYHSTLLKASTSYVIVEHFTSKYRFDAKVVDKFHEEEDESDDDDCDIGIANLAISIRGNCY